MLLNFRHIRILLTIFPLASSFAEIKTAAELSSYLTGTNNAETSFSLSATLAWKLENEYSIISVCDKTDFVCLSCPPTPPVDALRPGDLLDIDGIVLPDRDNHLFINCTNIHVVSHGCTPEILTFSDQDFRSGKLDNRPCRFVGTIRDVRQDEIDSSWDYVALDCGTIVITLIAWSDPGNRSSLATYIGSTVSGIGLCNALPTGFRRQRGRVIQIPLLSDLTILKPSPENPFNVPDLTITRGLMPRDFESLGPSRIRGDVLATWHGDTILIKTPDGAFARIESIENRLPDFGKAIEAVGYPETDLSQIILSRARWRFATEKITSKTHVTKSSIELLNGKGLDVGLNGQTVSTSGIVANLPTAEGNGQFFIQTGDQLVAVDASSAPNTLSNVSIGSTVKITGTYVVTSENWRRISALPRITGFFIALRQASDLTVLSEPPWWTPTRFLWVLALLVILIVVILAGNITLRTLVIRKSRALLKEQAEKISETLKTNERTRLAAELHDYHCQNLTAISYQVSSARNACKTDPDEAERLLSTASHMLKSCRTELRRCLWDLRNDVLNESDFTNAIHQTVSTVSGTAKVSVRFSGRRAQISDSTAHAILSILRELTSNAVNHGHATIIRIAGECRQQQLRFSVFDNGCGFNPETRTNQDDGHFGLDGITERLNRLGGCMRIESSSGQGCRIHIIIKHFKSPTQS